MNINKKLEYKKLSNEEIESLKEKLGKNVQCECNGCKAFENYIKGKKDKWVNL